MSDKFFPVFAKIGHQAKRKLSFCDVFVVELDDTNQETLFFVIEINSPSPKNKEIANLIVETTKEEYQKNSAKPIDEAFELSLKKLNETLENLVKDGEISWLGKLNGTIAVLKKKYLAFSTTGTGQVFLLRENNFIKISEGLYTPPEKPDPLKTFTNISFGEVIENDVLIFTSPEILHYVSPHKIKKIFSDNDVYMAAKIIQEELKDDEVILPCSLIIQIKNEEKYPAYSPLPEESQLLPQTEIEEETFYSFLKNKLLPFTINFYKTVFSFLKKVVGFALGILTALVSFLLNLAKPLVLNFKNQVKDFWGKRKKPKDQAEEIEKEAEVSFEEKPSFVPKTPSKKFLFEGFFSKIKDIWKNYLKITEALQTIKDLLKDIRSLKLSDFKNLKDYKNRSNKYYLTLFVTTLTLFIIALGFSIIRQKQIAQIQDNENLLKQAKMMITEAEAALIADDEIGRKEAQQTLADLALVLEKLEKSKYKKDEVNQIKQRVEKVYEKINKVFRLEARLLYNFTNLGAQNIAGLSVHNETFYLFDKEKARLFLFAPSTNNGEKIFESEEGKITSIHFLEDNLIILKDNKLYQFDEKTKSLIPASLLYDTEIKPTLDIDSYKNYLYLLSPQENQIFRSAKTLGGFARLYPYIKTQADIKDAVSFVIADYVYVLKGNGQVLRFASGYLTKFELKNLPDSLEKSSFIYTSPKISQIYILDPKQNRIVVLDKNGNYLKQYKSELFAKATSFYVSDKDNKIYFVADNNLYMCEE